MPDMVPMPAPPNHGIAPMEHPDVMIMPLRHGGRRDSSQAGGHQDRLEKHGSAQSAVIL
jgi:hypothetical protein